MRFLGLAGVKKKFPFRVLQNLLYVPCTATYVGNLETTKLDDAAGIVTCVALLNCTKRVPFSHLFLFGCEPRVLK